MEASRRVVEDGPMRFDRRGRVLTGAAATAAISTATTARASTNTCVTGGNAIIAGTLTARGGAPLLLVIVRLDVSLIDGCL